MNYNVSKEIFCNETLSVIAHNNDDFDKMMVEFVDKSNNNSVSISLHDIDDISKNANDFCGFTKTKWEESSVIDFVHSIFSGDVNIEHHLNICYNDDEFVNSIMFVDVNDDYKVFLEIDLEYQEVRFFTKNEIESFYFSADGLAHIIECLGEITKGFLMQ